MPERCVQFFFHYFYATRNQERSRSAQCTDHTCKTNQFRVSIWELRKYIQEKSKTYRTWESTYWRGIATAWLIRLVIQFENSVLLYVHTLDVAKHIDDPPIWALTLVRMNQKQHVHFIARMRVVQSPFLVYPIWIAMKRHTAYPYSRWVSYHGIQGY